MPRQTKKKSFNHLVQYLEWFSCLSKEEKREEIKKMDAYEKAQEGLSEFMENSRKTLQGDQ